MAANHADGIKNPAKWAEAKAKVAEQKGRSEAQFTDQDWLEVKRIYGSSINNLNKIMGLSHSLSAPTSLVGGAADLESQIKDKAKKLGGKIKKKKNLTKSEYEKILLVKSKIENLFKSDGQDGDKQSTATDMAGDRIDNHMLISQLESINHHVKEIQEHLKSTEIAPDWVKAKVATAADKLSDIAHYILGLNESDDGLDKTDEGSSKVSKAFAKNPKAKE